ncbi:hypothetical protein AusDCA_3987 [Desulfitobacterium sp. AusDCA]
MCRKVAWTEQKSLDSSGSVCSDKGARPLNFKVVLEPSFLVYTDKAASADFKFLKVGQWPI